VAKFIRDLALSLFIAVAIFLALNLFAWIYLQDASGADGRGPIKWQVNPRSAKGIELRKAALDIDDEDRLRGLDSSPDLRAHSVLHFTVGESNAAYTMGIEGIRYESEWEDQDVKEILQDSNTTYVFGGSTTFGHGVGSDQTITSYLNRIDDSGKYLNFGINAYDSLREVDKLVYLLRQGYRPETVIFIDGLNDVTTFTSTPHRAHDKPRTQGYLIDRGNPALIFGSGGQKNMMLAFAYSLPITHLYYNLFKPEEFISYGSVDSNLQRVDYRSLSYHYANQFDYGFENIDAIKSEWLEYYRENISFINGLSEAFGFEVVFVFQPFGVVEQENPFLYPAYFDSPGIIVAREFTDAVTGAIKTGALDMLDCQNAFKSIDKSRAFVDATHYSPSGNKALAECILNHLQGS
jgi:hypothetical protein